MPFTKQNGRLVQKTRVNRICAVGTPNRSIGLMSKVFANGPEDRGSIPGRFIPKTEKIVIDAALLNIQHYKVKIKGKVEQSMEKSTAFLNISV